MIKIFKFVFGLPIIIITCYYMWGFIFGVICTIFTISFDPMLYTWAHPFSKASDVLLHGHGIWICYYFTRVFTILSTLGAIHLLLEDEI